MWLLVFIPFAIGQLQPEPIGRFDILPYCQTFAAKMNTTLAAAKRQTWGEFDCIHVTNPILRGAPR